MIEKASLPGKIFLQAVSLRPCLFYSICKDYPAKRTTYRKYLEIVDIIWIRKIFGRLISVGEEQMANTGQLLIAGVRTAVRQFPRTATAPLARYEHIIDFYLTILTAGGFQVPSPGGRMEGASVFGQ
jgi:hypothetical protein